MKQLALLLIFICLSNSLEAQDVFGLEELKVRSNDFTQYVMTKGESLQGDLPVHIVPRSLVDFDLNARDSITMEEVKAKFVNYYDYLLTYMIDKGITTNNLTSIFIESADETSSDMKCIKEWYTTDVHTISLTLACYQSDIPEVKQSCIARSIHATIINNNRVAECFKSSQK